MYFHHNTYQCAKYFDNSTSPCVFFHHSTYIPIHVPTAKYYHRSICTRYTSPKNTWENFFTFHVLKHSPKSTHNRLTSAFLSRCQGASEGAQLGVTKAGFGFELWKLLWAPEVTANKIVTFITIIRIDGFQRRVNSSYGDPHQKNIGTLW